MSDTTSSSSVQGLNDRVTAIMGRAGLDTVPAVAEAVGVETKELYKALKAERENADYDGPALAAVEAYEAANPAEEGTEEEAAPAEKPKKKQARAAKPKKEKAPKAEKPVGLPTEVGKAQFSTGGRMPVVNEGGEEIGARSVYNPRLQQDGSYTGHIVANSRELLVTMPEKGAKGHGTWTVTGPKPTGVQKAAAKEAKPAKAAKKEKAAAPAATEEVKAVPKPSKKGKK